MLIGPLCEIVEIAPGLYEIQQTRSVLEYVRDIASEFGDASTLAVEDVEIDDDVMNVSVSVRAIPDYSEIVTITIAK